MFHAEACKGLESGVVEGADGDNFGGRGYGGEAVEGGGAALGAGAVAVPAADAEVITEGAVVFEEVLIPGGCGALADVEVLGWLCGLVLVGVGQGIIHSRDTVFDPLRWSTIDEKSVMEGEA